MLESGRLKQAFNPLSNVLRRSLSPGVLVFLTGIAEDKGYLLAEALGDTCRFIDNPQLKEKADGMWYVPDPNKASDLEKLREKSPLKAFEAYRAEKKLKKFRLEVVRTGFKKAFDDKDFATILGVGAKIPEDVINEDDKLLMWYNIAQRLGGR